MAPAPAAASHVSEHHTGVAGWKCLEPFCTTLCTCGGRGARLLAGQSSCSGAALLVQGGDHVEGSVFDQRRHKRRRDILVGLGSLPILFHWELQLHFKSVRGHDACSVLAALVIRLTYLYCGAQDAVQSLATSTGAGQGGAVFLANARRPSGLLAICFTFIWQSFCAGYCHIAYACVK